MDPCVLLIGYRQQLAGALRRLGIRYCVWSDKPLKSSPRGVEQVVIAPFPTPARIKRSKADDFPLHSSPTHVIAGTEAAVFPAALLRRVFGARRLSQTLLTRCTDKAAMKQHLSQFDVPMTAFVNHTPPLRAQDVVAELGLPVVIKNRRGSGGRDLVIARSLEAVQADMGVGRLYERYIDAPEGSVESIVHNGEIIFSSVTDYFIKKVVNIVPAGYSARELQAIEDLNRRVIKAMKIKWGLTHLEFYRTAGGVLFGEIALRPPGGYIMSLIELAHGFDPWEALVRVELDRPVPLPAAKSNRHAASYILHPGSGQVTNVFTPTTSQYPSLHKWKSKVRPGDTVDPRKSVGEDVGYCFFVSANPKALRADITKLQSKPPLTITPPTPHPLP